MHVFVFLCFSFSSFFFCFFLPPPLLVLLLVPPVFPLNILFCFISSLFSIVLFTVLYVLPYLLTLYASCPLSTLCAGVLLYSAADVEGHQGYDGRFYLLDFSRTFPPVLPDPKVKVCLSCLLSIPFFVNVCFVACRVLIYTLSCN